MIDITFDLETTALCPNAAVLSIGAVVWDMYGNDTPFLYDEDGSEFSSTFSVHIDLRRMFLDGFTFDKNTSEWWSRQDSKAKDAVLASDSEESPCSDIITAVNDFMAWIKQKCEENNTDQVCLWCQGSDFDIAILRNICDKYGIEIPVSHIFFRDHRSVFLECARDLCHTTGLEFDPHKAYSLVEPYEGHGAPHDPLYDCHRSIYSTWQIKKHKATLPQIFNS